MKKRNKLIILSISVLTIFLIYFRTKETVLLNSGNFVLEKRISLFGLIIVSENSSKIKDSYIGREYGLEKGNLELVTEKAYFPSFVESRLHGKGDVYHEIIVYLELYNQGNINEIELNKKITPLITKLRK